MLLVLRRLMRLVMALRLMLMVELGGLRLVVDLMGMLRQTMHWRLAESTERTIILYAVMRRHICVQTTSFEVRFHSQHFFRRREQFDGFH